MREELRAIADSLTDRRISDNRPALWATMARAAEKLRALSERAAVPGGWVIGRIDDGQLHVVGPPGLPGGMYPRPDAGPLSERLLHALAAAMLAAAPQPAHKCPQCNDTGEGYLPDGDGPYLCNACDKGDAPQPAGEVMPRQPDGYAYRYPSQSLFGGTDIRFSHGQEINGSKPIEAVPYYFGTPPSASLTDQADRIADLFDEHRKDLPSPWQEWAAVKSRALRKHAAACRVWQDAPRPA